jgi:hypothetical protein
VLASQVTARSTRRRGRSELAPTASVSGDRQASR